jgi:hypothetical protein
MMIPLSGRVPRRASGPSRTWVDDGGGLQYVSWIDVQAPRVFSTKGIYRWKGDVRGGLRGPHHLVARPGDGPRHPMVRPPPGSSPSLLWTPSVCQVTLAFVSSNSENISCVTFLKHKTTENMNWHCGILLIV